MAYPMAYPHTCCATYAPHAATTLYHAILGIWRGKRIPHTWLASRVVLIYKTKDPQDPKNYHPIYVSTAIYGILTHLLLKSITKAMTSGLLNIQHGTLSGRNTTTLATPPPQIGGRIQPISLICSADLWGFCDLADSSADLLGFLGF